MLRASNVEAGGKASSTNKRRLTVNVTPVGGTLRSIVVQVKRNGKVLGTGKLGSASRKHAVVVKLRSALKKGTYRAFASGRDALGHNVTAKPVSFKLR